MKLELYRFLCFKGGCLMRTMGKNKDYMNRYRFSRKIEQMKKAQTMCQWCFKERAHTLHHRNENWRDNQNKNLLPVCRKCHLEIKHQEGIKSPIPFIDPQKPRIL